MRGKIVHAFLFLAALKLCRYEYYTHYCDILSAINLYKSAIKLNSPEAMYELAYIYGIRVQQLEFEYKKTYLNLLERSASLNYVPALILLGKLYYQKDRSLAIVSLDEKKGLECYKKAAMCDLSYTLDYIYNNYFRYENPNYEYMIILSYIIAKLPHINSSYIDDTSRHAKNHKSAINILVNFREMVKPTY
jgi:hypothetical protein